MEVQTMANIKSAKKRILTSAKRTAANKAVKSSVKTAIKKVNKAVEAGDKEAAAAALIAAEATIDKAASKGVLHKNNASRKVARLANSINKI
jgi:small subunit ribosomal protein S20